MILTILVNEGLNKEEKTDNESNKTVQNTSYAANVVVKFKTKTWSTTFPSSPDDTKHKDTHLWEKNQGTELQSICISHLSSFSSTASVFDIYNLIYATKINNFWVEFLCNQKKNSFAMRDDTDDVQSH